MRSGYPQGHRNVQKMHTENDVLQGIIYRHFDASESDKILLNKETFFPNFEKMETDILLNFHSYFEPLKDTPPTRPIPSLLSPTHAGDSCCFSLSDQAHCSLPPHEVHSATAG